MVWQADYDEFYAARFAADGPVAVSVSLAHSEAAPERVPLEWRTSEPASFVATLERSEQGGEWRVLATPSPDGGDALRFDDRSPLAPGLYLLRLVTPGRVLTARGVVVR